MMRNAHFFALSFVLFGGLPLVAQDAARQTVPGAPDPGSSSNLPIQRVGPDDLLGLQVYDAPEFTRTVRIAADGTIRLPMMKSPLRVQGLLPGEIEALLTALSNGKSCSWILM